MRLPAFSSVFFFLFVLCDAVSGTISLIKMENESVHIRAGERESVHMDQWKEMLLIITDY